PRGLLERCRLCEVRAARVGDRGDAHAALFARMAGELLQPGNAGLAQALGVGHDVRLGNAHEIRCAEELPDLELVLERELAHRPQLAGEHGALLVVELHDDDSSRAWLPMRAPPCPTSRSRASGIARSRRASRRSATRPAVPGAPGTAPRAPLSRSLR